MSRRIIIDTDPGTDDAVAILLALASPELEVIGICAVAGNVPLAQAEWNARSICGLAGRAELPVHAGCPRAIGVTAAPGGDSIHGGQGLGDLVLPAPSAASRAQHAVDFLIESLRGSPAGSITVCALGPLTNIATALIIAPEIAGHMAELVIMGGASRAGGNVTPAAEFNIHCDPHAAAIVLASGAPITMVPLEVTQQVLNTPERVERVHALGNCCGAAAATLMLPPQPRGEAVGRRTVALHDPCVIGWLLAPKLFDGAKVNVEIETQSRLTSGMTVVDWRRVSGRPANARVLHTVDADAFYDLLTERLARLP
jgi:purine nucleosidase